MVAVPMGIGQEFHRSVGQLRDGRHDLVAQRSKLIVDEKRAVVAHGKPEVSACTYQHIDARRDFGGLYFHLREILLRPNQRRDKDCRGSDSDFFHGTFLPSNSD